MKHPIRYSALTLAGLFIATPVVAQDKIDFATQIYPIIKGSCSKCHQPEHKDPRRPTRTKKPKGGLVVTSKEGLLKGGSTQQDGEKGVNDATAAVEPGKPDKSELVVRIELPISDDDHQPPEGDAPQVTEAELKLLKKWIEEGAEFGDWKEDPKPHDVPEWDGKEFAKDSVRKAK